MKSRWVIVAFVAFALVLMGLPSFSSSAWATPAQRNAQQQSVPPVKRANMDIVCPGERGVFTLTFTTGSEAWYGVVVTDELHPYLRIDAVSTSQGTAGYGGQLVTVNVGDVAALTKVTITISFTVLEAAQAGLRICNTATVNGQDWPDPLYAEDCCIDVCEEFVPEPGSLLLLASGLAGLVGYAGLRRARRQG
ncbi:MAG: DUF11 domain-containing protein [Anaerolineae bacterium]|nr:DUF11 domain-containing protein [Anaerolineae bacterium]